MTTQTDILNLALYKLAQSNAIPTITEESKAADVMRRVWEPCLEQVLVARSWSWATRAEAISVSSEPAAPGWRYRYEVPNDCLSALAVTDENGLRGARLHGGLSLFGAIDFARSVLRGSIYDFELSYGEQATTINTDAETAYLVYVVRLDEGQVTRFPPNFVNALACRIAYEAAGPIIGEVGLNAKPRLWDEYQVALSSAGAHAMLQSRDTAEYVSPSILARN